MDLAAGPAANDWPHVSCTGWVTEAEVHIAHIVEYDRWEFGPHRALLPIAQELQGRWAWRLNTAFVDALASVQPDDVSYYASMEGLNRKEIQRLLELTALARSARAEGRDLYAWASL